MAEKKEQLREQAKGLFYWTKIVSLVVLITLAVIFVLQNFQTEAAVAFIGWHGKASTLVVIFFSFLAGAVATLLAVLIRRSSNK